MVNSQFSSSPKAGSISSLAHSPVSSIVKLSRFPRELSRSSRLCFVQLFLRVAVAMIVQYLVKASLRKLGQPMLSGAYDLSLVKCSNVKLTDILTLKLKVWGRITKKSCDFSCCWGFGHTSPFVAWTTGPGFIAEEQEKIATKTTTILNMVAEIWLGQMCFWLIFIRRGDLIDRSLGSICSTKSAI